jgi:hypothetical protein
MCQVLDGLHKQRSIRLIIEGGCPVGHGGADACAREWARSRRVNCLTIPPKADLRVNPSAGPARNAEIATWKPDVWVLFPGGKGTASAHQHARACGAEIIVVE